MEKFKERLMQFGSALRKHIDWIGIAIGLLFVLWLVYDLARTRLIELSTAGILLGAGAVLAALAYLFFRYFGSDFKGRLVGWLLIVLMVLTSVFGIGLSDQVTACLQRLAWHEKMFTEEIGVYTYAQAPVQDLNRKDLELSVGILEGTNENLNNYAIDQLREGGARIKVQSYGSIQQMMRALKGQSIQLLLLEPFQVSLAREYPDLEKADRELKKLTSYQYETSLTDSPKPVDIENESYSVLITSSVDPLSEQSYRTYQCMVAVVNPKSQRILLIHIPRNLLIPEVCQDDYACTPGQNEKVSLMTYSSQEVLRESVAEWLGTEINYSVRLDMNSLSQLIEKNGSVKVYNPNYYVTGNTAFNEGEIELNPVMAAIYLNDFNDFSEADMQIENNHLNVLRSMLPFQWIHSLFDMEPVLNTIRDSVQTNFSYNDLCEIVKTFILYPNHWDIQEMTPVVEDGFDSSSALSGYTYINGAWGDSQNRIRQAAQALKQGAEVSTDLSDIQNQLDEIRAQETEESQEQEDEDAETGQDDPAEQDAEETDSAGEE